MASDHPSRFLKRKCFSDPNFQRQQLAYLYKNWPEFVDDALVLEAWDSENGEDLLQLIRVQLAAGRGTTEDELVDQLRQEKLSQICGDRSRLFSKKENDMRAAVSSTVERKAKRGSIPKR